MKTLGHFGAPTLILILGCFYSLIFWGKWVVQHWVTVLKFSGQVGEPESTIDSYLSSNHLLLRACWDFFLLLSSFCTGSKWVFLECSSFPLPISWCCLLRFLSHLIPVYLPGISSICTLCCIQMRWFWIIFRVPVFCASTYVVLST